MSSCGITLKGIDFSCKDNVGGIKNIWLADWNAAAPSVNQKRFTATIRTGSEPSYTYVFKLYRIRTGNGSMTSTMNADEANGTVFVQTDLNMKFTKLTEDGRNEVAEILRGNVAAIVETNTGEFYGLGAEHPLTFSAGTADTGAAMGDFAGYDVTVQDYCSTLPYLLDETLIEQLPKTVE